MNPNLTFEVLNVPPGEWEVRASGGGLEGTVRVRSGESADIRLRAP